MVDHCKIMTQLQASDSSRHNLDHDASIVLLENSTGDVIIPSIFVGCSSSRFSDSF